MLSNLEENVLLYVETVTFDEIFRQQLLPRIEVFFRKAVVPEFKEMYKKLLEFKNCINMVAGRTSKKEKMRLF